MEAIRTTLSELYDEMGDIQADGESVGSYTQEFLDCTLLIHLTPTPSIPNLFYPLRVSGYHNQNDQSCDDLFWSIIFHDIYEYN